MTVTVSMPFWRCHAWLRRSVDAVLGQTYRDLRLVVVNDADPVSPWPLLADITVEDMTHENYWRQLLRWLVDGVPDHVEAHTSAERVEAGETVTLSADVVDPTFVEINDARVVAQVERPPVRGRRHQDEHHQDEAGG